MRLIILLLTTAIIQVSASSYGQNVTLKKENAGLKTVLDDIRKQTGYDFFYSDQAMRSARSISIHVKNVSLVDALEICFKDQPLTYTIESKSVTIKPKEPSFLDKLADQVNAYLTDIDARGRILDESGAPLEGATIVLKGSDRTTKTDAKGEFVLANVPDDGVLVIRYVGYKQLEISLKDAVMPLEIKLNVATGELEEVKVVYNTGYQELNKERATGSFVQIDNELFNRRVGGSVLERIYDLVPGLINNKNGFSDPIANITIRGTSTINANKQPLLVVDNFIYQGDSNNLNPNDFWASWCKPCRADIPNLKKVYGAFHHKGFNILSISTDSSLQSWQKALKEENTSWINGIQEENPSKDIFGLFSIPAYILVNEKAEIVMMDMNSSFFSPSALGTMGGAQVFLKDGKKNVNSKFIFINF